VAPFVTSAIARNINVDLMVSLVSIRSNPMSSRKMMGDSHLSLSHTAWCGNKMNLRG